MGVVDNFGYAVQQYEAWVKTGKFPISGWGDRKTAMQKSFKFYNSMIKAGATTEEFNAFMIQSTTVGQLAKDTGANRCASSITRVCRYTSKWILYYWRKDRSGFYQNLIGNFDNLTKTYGL